MRKLVTTIAIAGIAMFGWASDARADLIIGVSTDGVTYTTLANVTGSPTTDLVGGFFTFTTSNNIKINIQGGEANQTATFSQELSSATSLTNQGSTTSDVFIRVEGTGFTSPIGDSTLTSEIGGSTTIGSPNNLLSFTSCVSQTNDENCTQTAPVLSPSITGNAASYNANNSIAVTGLASPFSVVEVMHFTLGAGSTLNYSASSTLVPTPVPEPATTALFGLGLLGVGRSVRRHLGNRA